MKTISTHWHYNYAEVIVYSTEAEITYMVFKMPQIKNIKSLTEPLMEEILKGNVHTMDDRLSYLRNKYQRLERMANDFGMYIQSKGGDITLEERAQARHLLDMMNAVQSEGVEVCKDSSIEIQKEFAKCIKGI